MVIWKHIADWAKRRPGALRLADRLGRGRGKLRFLDRVGAPHRAPLRPDMTGWENCHLGALWIGHATVLLRIGGQTVLTDPVLANRIGLGLGFVTGGPARRVAPALRIAELPHLDLILLSHAHFDHLDRPTLARLPRTTPVVTAGRTRDLIEDMGFADVTELNWGEDRRFGDLRVQAWEVRHWGARTFVDSHRQACAYIIEAGGRRVLFGGDTAVGPHFRAAGKMDLAILGIGAYNPFIAAHATPEQAWKMAADVRADFVLPMHHSTFRLSHEPLGEPMERLRDVARRGMERVVASRIGEVWSLN